MRHWLANCRVHHAEIVALYDKRFFRMWEFYLAAAAVGFEEGTMNNFHVQYVRNRRALPITRDYIVEAEQRYLRPPHNLRCSSDQLRAAAGR